MSFISLNKEINKVSAVSGTYTLTLSDIAGIVIGATVSIKGLPNNAWNVENETVDAVNPTLKTVQVSHGNATIAEQEVDGILHINVQWIDAAYVETILGYEPSGDDATYLDECVDAAEDWVWRMRQSSGYKYDHPNIAPSADIRLGTGLYALALFREKGTVDGFASFDGMNIPAVPTLSMGRILQLIGCKKPQVG